MKQPKWINTSLATAIHDEAIYEFGGLAGIRDPGLLASALDRPRNLLAYEPRSSIFALAALLCAGIARNHPFNDGNKRTALLATRAFLYLNGHEFEPPQEEEVATLIGVAEGSLDELVLATWLKRRSHRRRRTT
ncbi:MAG TPA: type II toxin-antitoxin system death-on-curing family toxin [Steroidobacteraceae bacterium]|nr:type II toxin-antitoxin system death-on-curing family toxin [Steroidobacteraceae bacterium]